ncbi:hypothetical protein [Pantoea sp. 18069]|uniref:hypothetical protein n=1 Tax=Pantoea sp. 18069 TaxID=2681415 RepID=UPI001359B04A|nr:hypothetical protein [Pantoea sp. 18069]
MSAVSPMAARPLNLSSISASDIAAVKNASDREKIGGTLSRVWDKISDMFLGTDRAQAKKCLFDLYLPNTSDAQKIKSFLTLQSLAGDGYKDRFQHTVENGMETYALLLDGDEKGEGVLLSRKIIACDRQRITEIINGGRETENLEVQMKKDVTRGDYHIDHRPLADGSDLTELRTEVRLHVLDKELDALECTPEEKKSILALANQATFALIMQSTVATHPAEQGGWVPPLCPCSEEQSTEYRITREDGVIRLRALCAQDIAAEKSEELRDDKKQAIQDMPHFYQSLEIRIDIAINAQGESEIRQLDYLVCKGPEPR